MNTYKPRTIKFKEVLVVRDWRVKVYTISKTESFNNPEFYEAIKQELPEWLSLKNSFNSTNDKIAFLILHSGTEGIFSLINWWVGTNMLNTHIFVTNYNQTSEFKKISGDGLAPCVWELEIINHERKSWLENILKQDSNPQYDRYINDTITKEI